MSGSEDTRFDEDQVRAVLSRAIALDARGAMTTVDDLRAIAGELGVSQASLDAALRERGEQPSRHRSFGQSATAVAVLGLPLGAAAGIALSTLPIMQAALALNVAGAAGLVASGAILVLLRSRATLRSFGIRNLALWGGYAAGGLAAIALFGGQTAFELPWLLPLGGAARGFATAMVLGTAGVLAIRRAVSDNGAAAGPRPASSVFQRAKDALLRTAKRILEHGSVVMRDVVATRRMARAASGRRSAPV
ncbi:MAG: hypothetical protein WEF86_03100 [Gemmatimonadota bacterium]